MVIIQTKCIVGYTHVGKATIHVEMVDVFRIFGGELLISSFVLIHLQDFETILKNEMK